ncbi:MAG: sigma-E factor negative regulatory protein [Gammaproteobacteria bacterium]
MSSDQLEKISAFMDAEASHFELKGVFKEMLHNEDHLKCWERYHLIRDALRGDLPRAVNPVFADALMSRLSEEPAHSIAGPSRWYKPAAGVALAASVAAVSVFGIKAFNDGETPVVPPPIAQNAKTKLESIVAAQREKQSAAQPPADLPTLASASPTPELRRVALSPFEQASYLANHSQYAGGPASVPHLRLVVTDIKPD